MGRQISPNPKTRKPHPHKSGENCLTAVKWIPIEEKVGWSQGRYTVVNILKPSLRVERTPLHMPIDPAKKDREDFLRIILTFKLQVDIAGFDHGGRYSAGNRFFDNISLRYLFTAGERHRLTPKTDPIQRAIKTTNETTHTKSLDTGISGVTPATFMPKLEAHLTSEGKVTVEQDNQKSWRSGLSFETYDPPCLCHCHDHQNHHAPCHHCYHLHGHNYHYSRNCRNHYHSYGSGDLITLSPVLIAKHHHHHHPERHFTLKSEHARDCARDESFSPHTCHLQQTGAIIYDKAAHWSWQARADIELWGPENYESKSRQITIVREVSGDEIDRWVKPKYATEKEAKEAKEHLRKYLHFDFLLESRLKELDHGWNGFKNSFRKWPKPPEMRRKADTGMPLKADRASFCISPCYKMVEWPPGKTRDTLKEADKIVTGEMKSKDGKILSNVDYEKHKAEKKRGEKETGKEASRDNPVIPAVRSVRSVDGSEEDEDDYRVRYRQRRSSPPTPEFRRRHSSYERRPLGSFDHDEYERGRSRPRRRSIGPLPRPPPRPPPRPGGYYQTGPVPVFLQQQREYRDFRRRSRSPGETIIDEVAELEARLERLEQERQGRARRDWERGRSRSRSSSSSSTRSSSKAKPKPRVHGAKEGSRSSSEGSVVRIVHDGRRPGKPSNHPTSNSQQQQQQQQHHHHQTHQHQQSLPPNAADEEEEILRLRRDSDFWRHQFQAERRRRDMERMIFQDDMARLRRFRVRSLSPSPRRPRRRHDTHSPHPSGWEEEERVDIRVRSTSRAGNRSRSRSRN